MDLTKVEREKVTDSMLKVQSIRGTLEAMDASKIPHAEEIEACLESADQSFKVALGYSKPPTG